MGQIAKRIEDRRLLKLIRAFLNAGVMENGLVSPSVEGTPQGGPLSPLLSNLVLDELDRELEHRGHRLYVMRTTVISTFAANARVSG
jgi:RNA-directed DNA polymerase